MICSMYVHNMYYVQECNTKLVGESNQITYTICYLHIDFHGTVSDLFLHNSHSAIDELCKLTVCTMYQLGLIILA